MKTVVISLSVALGMAMAAWAATFDDNVDVEVVVARGESMLSLSSNQVAWTAYVASGVIERVNSRKMTCHFFPANGPWEIKVYHTNESGQALRGEGVSRTLWTKVWQPNYGPTNFYALGYMPNPMDSNVWTKCPTVAMELNPGTFAKQGNYDTPPIDFHFIIDAVNAPATTYVGAIYFELQVP